MVNPWPYDMCVLLLVWVFLYRKVSHSYPDPTLINDYISSIMWGISISVFNWEHLPAIQMYCQLACRGDETDLLEIFLKTDTWRLPAAVALHAGVWGRTEPPSCTLYHAPQQSHTYLFYESCCLQAAFAICHLILKLLPQLLQVVCLPQDVHLVRWVLLAQIPAPPHHICTYGPVGVALRFKSLAEGQETCEHNSLPTSWSKERVLFSTTVMHVSKSPVFYPCLWLLPEPWDDCLWAPHTQVTVPTFCFWCEVCYAVFTEVSTYLSFTTSAYAFQKQQIHRYTQVCIKITEEAPVSVLSCKFSNPQVSSLVYNDSLL